MKKENKKYKLFTKIRKMVSKIPKGRVATYGQIGRMVGISDARKVGWAVYGNQNVKVPCHRVVFADGRLSPNFSLGGYKEQKKRLQIDGVKFVKPTQVDLSKYLWESKFHHNKSLRGVS